MNHFATMNKLIHEKIKVKRNEFSYTPTAIATDILKILLLSRKKNETLQFF